MEYHDYDVSDAIVNFLVSQEVSHVFCVSGGSIHNILAKIEMCNEIQLIPCYHEQGACFAAEGYARATNKPGVIVVTSGPGLTNIITGINSAWVDGIPLFILAGQVVESQRLIHSVPLLRQRGVQESDTHSLVTSITKKSTTLLDASSIENTCNDLWFVAMDKRKGPVVLEIPVDKSYQVPKPITEKHIPVKRTFQSSTNHDGLIQALNKSIRPFMVIGNGVRSVEGIKIKRLLTNLQSSSISYASTWGSKDIIEDFPESPLYLGSPGIFGNRLANAALLISDCIIVIGCSFSYAHTGYRVASLSLKNLHIVDIDIAQLSKPEFSAASSYHMHADEAIDLLLNHSYQGQMETIKQISKVSMKVEKEEGVDESGSTPVDLIKYMNGRLLNKGSNKFIIVTDMGTSFTATHHYLKCNGARLFTASGHAPMGWGLPGAIGACLATNNKKRVICLTGDGGLLMNIQELMHLSFYRLNILVVLLNNNGYATIAKTTQRYHGKAIAASKENGIVNPDFKSLCQSYQLPYLKLSAISDIIQFMDSDGPLFIELNYSADEYIGPRLMASSNSQPEHLHMHPLLSNINLADEFNSFLK